jgi:hypothetical protein
MTVPFSKYPFYLMRKPRLLFNLDIELSQNKIVQRFYETPEGLSSGSNKRKAKIPIPAAPKTGFPLRFNTLLGYFGIFTTAHRAVVPHFRFKKDLILYLNSSRAASSGEFKFKLQWIDLRGK